MPDAQEITFITSHAKKAEELSRHLNYPIIHYKLALPEVQSLDPDEVIRQKAELAYKKLKRPILVEDFSLSFEVLGKLPGPLIKWFLQELKPEGICRLLDSYKSRKAIAEIHIALLDKSGVHIFRGKMNGSISSKPKGNAGFGTDGIFIPDGQKKTWAEMTKEEQIKNSVRRIALKQLETYLQIPRDTN